MSASFIGSADGPTAIFVAGKVGVNWINIYGFVLIALMLMPNIVYFRKNPDKENRCTNKAMNILEEVGRILCVFFMCFNIGLAEFGFPSGTMFLTYLFGNVLLMIIYRFTWGLYYREEDLKKAMVLAITPTLMFLLSGITLRHYLLVVSAVIFGISHIYVTYVNHKE